MIRLIRIFGLLMMAAGVLILLSYLIAPLRFVWMALRTLPLPIQIGLAAAAAGLLLLFGTLIWERVEEREADRELRDDTPRPPPAEQEKEEEKSA